jgi:hypothetical protein
MAFEKVFDFVLEHEIRGRGEVCVGNAVAAVATARTATDSGLWAKQVVAGMAR